MATVIAIPGTIEAVTVYAKNDAGILELVGRNEKVTLPEITRMTFDQKMAGGTQAIPSNLIEDMETSMAKNGTDENMARYINAKDIEYRWVQTLTETDGTVRNIGYKVMMTTASVTVNPGAEIDVGSGTENDLTKKALSYTLYRDGVEIINVNKITGECTILGKKYGVDSSLL